MGCRRSPSHYQALVVAPAYKRPSQEGLYQHFTTLARGSALPMLVHNVPSPTVTDVEPETLARIVTECPDVITGVKDSSADLIRVSEHRKRLGPLPAAHRQRRARPCVQRPWRDRLHLGHRQRGTKAVRRMAAK